MLVFFFFFFFFLFVFFLQYLDVGEDLVLVNSI